MSELELMMKEKEEVMTEMYRLCELLLDLNQRIKKEVSPK